MAFFTIAFGMYIHDHVKRLVISDESYSTQLSPLLTLAPTSVFSLFNLSLAASSPIPFERAIGRVGPKTLWHSMSDEELAWQASTVPRILEYLYNRTPKVAFMFLSRGRLPLAPLWKRFFKGHEDLYSIYLHMSVDHSNDEMPETSVFYKRRIPSKVRVIYSFYPDLVLSLCGRAGTDELMIVCLNSSDRIPHCMLLIGSCKGCLVKFQT